jgi:hypothetical protein
MQIYLYLLIFIAPTSEASSSQITIRESFNKSGNKPNDVEPIIHFKRLLLNFIINNNISFRAITTPSFAKLLQYFK